MVGKRDGETVGSETIIQKGKRQKDKKIKILKDQ